MTGESYHDPPGSTIVKIDVLQMIENRATDCKPVAGVLVDNAGGAC